MELTLREQRLLAAFRECDAGVQKVIEDVVVHMMEGSRRVAAENPLLCPAAIERKRGRAVLCRVK